MEAQVVLNVNTQSYELTIEIDGIKTIISTSKNFGHWQYHYNRGTLPKAVAKYGITDFQYVGFDPSNNKPSAPKQEQVSNTVSSWFMTSMPTAQLVRGRGRPKKYGSSSGTVVHKMGDSDSSFRCLTIQSRSSIIKQFKDLQAKHNITCCIEEICKKFKIPYKQAYEIVSDIDSID